MGAERTGTVTFLFTDIEGSTQRWAHDQSAMAVALEAHDTILRDTIERHGGEVFKHTGDGVVAVFDSAQAAVRAAVAAQGALDLPVRMGLHTGEAERRGDDYFGNALNRCARIMDAGHGGQVLISSATRELIDDPEVVVVDLGRHRLKGIEEQLSVHQVGHGDHPPLRTSTGDVRLPVVSSALVGRDDLVARLADELDDHRLLTLTGVGGSGKTRVAIAVADARSDRHDLVVFVGLGEISDDDEVVAAVCRALGTADHRLSVLRLALSGRDSLLVLDNCEHVLGAAADLAEALLAIPGIRIVVTSREGLGIDGERVVAIPGLSADDVGSAAVTMFLDRAGSAVSDPGGDDLAVIRDICRRLDGLPLAIELAAARAAVLSPADLLARLDERFQLLTGGRRKRSRDRHKTLRETIDWSYELLDDDERDLFELMSVFGGSFTLDSAVALAGERNEYDVLDLLEALIDKSLLTTVDVEGEHRYRYLETIRSYAEERFDARPDAKGVLDAFQSHLEDLVTSIVDELTNEPRSAARWLRAEIPNLRAGFDHALDRGDGPSLAALIGPLAGCATVLDWQINGWAAEALAVEGVSGSPVEPHLLAVHLNDQWLEGRFDVLRGLTEHLLSSARTHGITSESIERSLLMGFQLSGHDSGLERSADVVTDRFGNGSTMQLGAAVWVAWTHAEPFAPTDDDIWTTIDESVVDAALKHDDARIRCTALAVRGHRARHLADYDVMLQCSRQLTELATPGSPLWFTALQIRSFAEYYLGDPAAAIGTAEANLDEAYRLGDRSAMVPPLLVDALVLESLGEHDAAATVRGRLPRRMTAMFIRELAELDRRVRAHLAPGRFAELADTGRAMTPRELHALTRQAAEHHLDLAGGRAPAG